MKRIVAGPRAVVEAVRAHAGEITVVYLEHGARKTLADVAKEVAARGVKIEERGREELDAIAKGNKHQGIVAIAGEYAYAELDDVLDASERAPLLVALDEITDPHNFGAIVRSAVAFDADAVITLKHRAAPVTPVVVRASAGATEHAKIVRVTNLARTLHDLAERGLSIVGLDAEGDTELDRLPEAPSGRVLVIGAEGKGLRRLVKEHCSILARIAHPGPVESLNASVAASIALYCAWRQR